MMAFLSHKCKHTLDIFPEWIDGPLPVTVRSGLSSDIKTEPISPVLTPLPISSKHSTGKVKATG